MDPPASKSPIGAVAPLVEAALWAVAAAILAREAGWTGVCAACPVAAWCAVRGRPAALLAIPAALAAVSAPRAPWQGLEIGPVVAQGTVTRVLRWDPVEGAALFTIERGGRAIGCVADRALDIVVGDEVRLRGRSGGGPWLHVPAETIEFERRAAGPAAGLVRLRRALQQDILRRIPGEPGRLVAGLVFGHGPRLADDLVRAHRATGLAHLLAVSGAHVAMVAWLLGLAFGGGWPWHRRGFRRSCAWILLAYGGLAGLEAPVFRAVAAFLVGLWVGGRGRRFGLAPALAVPALLTCLVDPGGVLSVSFCLSYAAVFGLSLSGPWRGTRIQRWLWVPARGSLWAMITTAPVTCWAFSQLAPATILGTPLLAPLVALVLGGGLLICTLGAAVPPLGDAIAPGLEAMARIYAEGVRALDHCPWTPLLAAGRPAAAAVALAGAAGLALSWRWPLRARVCTVCAALCLPHFWPGAAPPPLQVLDVGHGQACILRTSRRTVLVDCGSLLGARSIARDVATSLGGRRIIDLLVLTHGDHDHTAAVAEVLAAVRVGEVLAPQFMANHPAIAAARAAGVPVRWLAADASWSPSPQLRVWCPPRARRRNDESLWVWADVGTATVLLPGDAQEAGVRAAILSGAAAPAQVLLLPHHGRANRELDTLLDIVRPAVALVSGPRPGAATRELLAQRAIALLSTGDLGKIQLDPADPGGPYAEGADSAGSARFTTEHGLPLRTGSASERAR